MSGVICLGEALIDFTPLDEKNKNFCKNPGGAPANVAVALSRLEVNVNFISKVGSDFFGRYLKNKLEKENVNAKNIFFTNKAKTGITFVTIDSEGDRSFNFYGNPSADRLLKKEEVYKKLFKENNIFHFGAISLIEEPARNATKYALKLAEENDLIISFDPNLRFSLWPNRNEAKEQLNSVLNKCDILKVSKEELEFISSKKEIEKGLEIIKSKYNISLIFITVGGKGAYFYKDKLGYVPGNEVEVVDTIGAGDSFLAAILYNINKFDKSIDDLSVDILEEITEFANLAASLTVTKRGAMSGMPTLKNIIL